MKIILILFWILHCSTVVLKDYSTSEKSIEEKINFLLKSDSVNLLVINPPELQNHSCNYTEDFFQKIIIDTDYQIKDSLLKKFGNREGFHLVDRSQIKYLFQEMKIQASGITSKELSKLGNLTGANYVLMNSNEMNCSKGDLILNYNKEIKLLHIQTAEVLAIDKLFLKFQLNRSEYELDSAYLGEKEIQFYLPR